MKKIAFFLTACFILGTANAQVVLLDESFENGIPTNWVTIDNDGDGFNWQIGSAPNMAVNTGTQCINSASYENTAGALTPDNYLITSAIAIPSQGAELSWFVTGQDLVFYSEKYKVMVSTTGQTVADFTGIPIFTEIVQTGRDYQLREVSLTAYAGQIIYIAFIHTDVTDMFYLNIDDIKVTENPIGPTIISTPTNIDFGTIENGISSNSSSVICKHYNLTTPIVATTSTPFEISADNVTFGTTATLSKDTFYVRYNPTVAGVHSSIVVLSSTGVNDTISLTGEAIVCNTISSFPYEYGFERNAGLHACWQIVDANNDGKNTFGKFSFLDATGGNGVAVHHYPIDSISPAANDWLISPLINISTDLFAFFDYMIGNNGYYYFAETFSVWAIHEDSTYTNARLLIPAQTVENYQDFETIEIDLRSLRGNYRIAIKVETLISQYFLSYANYHYFVVDNFKLEEIASTLTTTTTAINLGEISLGKISDKKSMSLSAMNVTGIITVEVNDPFEVSYNGGTYANSIQIPGETNLTFSRNIDIRFRPTALGSFNEVLKISTPSINDTLHIVLSGKAVDCNGILTLPFTEGFENGLWLPSGCWNNLDADGDGFVWGLSLGSLGHTGIGCAYSSSFSNDPLTPDNYLITPKIRIPSEGATLSFWIAASDANFSAEGYRIKVSNTDNNVTNFTQTIHNNILNNAEWLNEVLSLNQFAGQDVYIAFVHTDVTNMMSIKLDDISITAGVGIAESSIDNSSINIYPNPAKENFKINASSHINQVDLYSISGQLIYTAQPNDLTMSVNTSKLAQGLYIVKVYTEDGFTTEKISIIK